MSSYNKASLYDANEIDEEYIKPNIEFEFVQVEDTKEEEQTSVESKQEADNLEFDFPLFGSNPSQTAPEEVEFPLFSSGIRQETSEGDSNERGRSTTVVSKISLREESVEAVRLERPRSYYFAYYTDNDRARFEEVAITAEQIYQYSRETMNSGAYRGKVLDVSEHNRTIESLQKKKSRSRPGKKKRLATIECRQRRQEREVAYKKAEKERLAKLKKKMFHKRGGKKHKKDGAKGKQAPQKKKPKYKTE